MAITKKLGEITKLLGGELIGKVDIDISDVGALDESKKGDITFFASKDISELKSTKASAVIVPKGTEAIEGKNFIVVDNPLKCFAIVADLFRPRPLPEPGISDSSFIHDGATIGKNVAIGPFVYIEDGAVIGDGVKLLPGVYIGKNVRIGKGSLLYSNVSIREGTIIGKRFIANPNVVVGGDGYGYVTVKPNHFKVPQVGIVRIGDDVELGAGVTVDRATIGETVIGRGTKVDNLVHIAHNVKVGEDCLIISHVGIAGSSTIGDRVTLAGKVGVAGHISVASDTIIGAKSGITKDVKKGGVYAGFPLQPHKEWLTTQALVLRLPEMKKRIEELEGKLKELEEEKN